VFLSARRPGRLDLRPYTGPAWLGYDRVRVRLDQCTRTPTTPGWDLHQLRHSAATHLGEANAGLQLIMAKGRWRNPRTAMRYVKPGARRPCRSDRTARYRAATGLTAAC
jgi:hypothetical protein